MRREQDGYESDLSDMSDEESYDRLKKQLDVVMRTIKANEEEEIRSLRVLVGELKPGEGFNSNDNNDNNNEGNSNSNSNIDDIKTANDDVKTLIMACRATELGMNHIIDEFIDNTEKTILNEIATQEKMKKDKEILIEKNKTKNNIKPLVLDEQGKREEAKRILALVALERIKYRRTLTDKLLHLT